jgi:hypothetical protein
MSDENPNTPETEMVENSGQEMAQGRSFVSDLANVFHPDELPEAIRARLLHEGYIRMDADGLFNADRYVLPDQIASVTGDGVVLKVSKDQLVKTH